MKGENVEENKNKSGNGKPGENGKNGNGCYAEDSKVVQDKIKIIIIVNSKIKCLRWVT